MGVRDAAYLRWRFAMRPDQAYRFVQLRRPWQRLPCGVVVLGPTGRNVAAGMSGGVPKASDLKEEQVLHLDWWLMAGDTDFL